MKTLDIGRQIKSRPTPVQRVHQLFSRFNTTEQLTDTAHKHKAGFLKKKKNVKRSKSHSNIQRFTPIDDGRFNFKVKGGAVAIDRSNFMDREVRLQTQSFLQRCAKAVEDLKSEVDKQDLLKTLSAMSALFLSKQVTNSQ